MKQMLNQSELMLNIRMSMAEELRIGTLHEIYRCVLIYKGALKLVSHGDHYQIYGNEDGHWKYLGFLSPKRSREDYK